MKKVIAVISFILIFGLISACSGIQTPSTGGYKNGTYTAKGDPWAQGSEDAKVVISGGKITEITLRRLDKDGNEVDYNIFNGLEHSGKTYPNLKAYRQELAQKMIDKQTYQVDTLSGATTTTGNWKLAVKRALQQAGKY
ncbi:MAG: FMN-binding protein [Clostridia bacterium]|nr:FMN-binding protein [Clostridia bacterium]